MVLEKILLVITFILFYDGSIMFHWNDVADDFGNPQERTLITLPNTIIELAK